VKSGGDSASDKCEGEENMEVPLAERAVGPSMRRVRSIRGGNKCASCAGIENGLRRDRGWDYDRVAG
jgi:hypothetical protein